MQALEARYFCFAPCGTLREANTLLQIFIGRIYRTFASSVASCWSCNGATCLKPGSGVCGERCHHVAAKLMAYRNVYVHLQVSERTYTPFTAMKRARTGLPIVLECGEYTDSERILSVSCDISSSTRGANTLQGYADTHRHFRMLLVPRLAVVMS